MIRNLAHSRRLAPLAAGAALLGALLLSPPPAQAATQFTWTGGYGIPHADHHSWTDPLNWSPQEVPTDGDAVTVGAIAGQGAMYIDAIPSISLSSLVVAGTDESAVHLGTDGEQIAVTDSFTWTGGEIVADLDLPGSASGTITAGGAKSMSGNLTVAGTLSLDHLGADPFAMRWRHRLVVTDDGTLVSVGDNHVGYDSCCSTPNRLVSTGTLAVQSGTLWLEGVELDQSGAVEVADGSTLRTTLGPVQLGPDASWSGPGTVRFEDATSPDPDPEHPDVSQGALLVSGSNVLSDGLRMVIADGSALTGTGSLTGSGSLSLDAATVYAHLTLGDGVSLDVAGPDASNVGVWDRDMDGYHGRLTVQGAATVPSGSELDLGNGTLTTLTKGGSLAVMGGGAIGSWTCCSSAPELVTTATGSLTLGGGDQPATLRWIHLRTKGHTQVPGGARVELVKTTVDQRAGTTMLGSGATVSTPDLAWRLRGGLVTGSGHLAGSLVNSSGTVSPGSGRRSGALRVDSYRQGRHGTLRITLAGRKASRLVAAGTAHLGGRLATKGSLDRGRSAGVVSGHPVSGRFGKVVAGGAAVRYSRGRVVLVAP